MVKKLLIFSILFLQFFSFTGCNTFLKKSIEENSYSVAIDSSFHAINEVIQESQIPGLSVSVAVKGKLVWSEGFGYSDIKNKVEVDPAKTLFRIGSVSKTLTASGLALLYERGKVDLDAEIHQYLPDYPQKKYPITTRQIGGHIAGIRHYFGDEMYSDKYYATIDEGLEIFMHDSLLFEPGTQYAYSSYGWNLISAIMEKVSGEVFLEFMKSNVFVPLNMNNTLPDFANQEIEQRTSFYILNDSTGIIQEAPYVDNSYKWAGGGFLSTTEDLIRFGNAHLDSGFLKKSTLNEFITSQQLFDGTNTNYGIGWRHDFNEDGLEFYGHSGGSVGGITMLAIYPEEEIVIALLTNSSHVNYKGVFHNMARWFKNSNQEEK